jgi:signal transduction histidine kinase
MEVRQEKEHKFKPRARLMLLLGDELIRDSGIAVFELVKNAYDADASLCTVTLCHIHDKENPDAKIMVEDNGTGMDLDTILDVWLEPGAENRKDERVKGERTKKFKRLPLGEKGVGRFAAHKLGKKIQVVSRAKLEKEVRVQIDWRDFEKAKYLSDVKIDIEEREPRVFRHNSTGTRIEITDLREMPWNKRRVRNLWRSITSICSPFGGPDDFKACLTLEPSLDWLKGLLDPKNILKQSLFRFAGKIDGKVLSYDYEFTPRHKLEGIKGRAAGKKQMPVVWSAEDPETGKREKIMVDLAKYKVGPVRLVFHMFDQEPLVLRLASTDAAGLKAYLNNSGGVRVYRDGVRVYDFGEPGNDWLDLGGKRVNVPARRISNNQIVGAVMLDLEASTDLIEKTNREGFVESEAYEHFRYAVEFAVQQAQHERNFDKGRIHKVYSRGKKKEPVLEDLTRLRKEVEKRGLEKPLMQYIDRVEIQYREVLDRLLVAAGAGLNLAAVMHEVEKGISSLYDAISRGDDQKRLVTLARRLSDMVDGLNWLTRKTGKANVKASVLIKQAIVNSEFRFRGHGIDIFDGIQDYSNPDFEVKCSRRLIMTVLSNLIDNAIYWLDVKGGNQKWLYIGTTYDLNELPAIVVADNGPGLVDPPEYLIQPFVSRKPDGMGLGLHVADEIMKTQNGKLLFPEVGDLTLPKGYTGAIIALEFKRG